MGKKCELFLLVGLTLYGMPLMRMMVNVGYFAVSYAVANGAGFFGDDDFLPTCPPLSWLFLPNL
jgi:hypothetical protein